MRLGCPHWAHAQCLSRVPRQSCSAFSRSPAANSSSPGFGAPYRRQCSIWESLGIERARLAGVARVEKGMWQVGRRGQNSGPSLFY